MKIFGIEIKSREVAISVAIVLVLAAIGFLIHNQVEESLTRNAEVYNRAYKPSTAEQFAYAARTNVGHSLMVGELSTDNPVQTKHCKGDYMKLKVVHERYTMHTRTVTDSDGDSHIETYWTWDYAGEERLAAEEYTFCGLSGAVDDLKFKLQYISTDHPFGYDRWVVYGAPQAFEATILADLRDNRIQPVKQRGVEVYRDQSVVEVIEAKNSKGGVVIFDVLWIVFIVAAVIIFRYMENRWLDGGTTDHFRRPFSRRKRSP
jgi:hypothetical protein